MASKQEQAAGNVKAWTANNQDPMGVTDDLVHILRLCHEYRAQPDRAPLMASDLADEIAEYLTDAYGPVPLPFDDEEKDEADA